MTSQRTVLIVEDEPQYRERLQEALKTAGFQVLAAASANQALGILKTREVDCILLDLLMPEMDGTEFFYHLRNELHLKTPTIILTNLAQSPHQADISEYLVKANTSLDQVIAAVHRNIVIEDPLIKNAQ